IQLLKAFNASNQSGKYYSAGYVPLEMAQHPMAAPSVFNFFLPTYAPPGEIFEAGLVAPEFQIVNSAAATDYINIMYGMLLSDYYMDVTTGVSTVIPGSPDYDNPLSYPENIVQIDVADEVALAEDVPQMIDRLDILLTGGTMTQPSKDAIIETVEQFSFEPSIAAKLAILMVMIAPDYVIQK
ncbi:MAG: hypothetical protein HKN32_06955, partial [Flavobacteriales bacterium]|nr:hypothetical protein [Flavobacteriales bacterium]